MIEGPEGDVYPAQTEDGRPFAQTGRAKPACSPPLPHCLTGLLFINLERDQALGQDDRVFCGGVEHDVRSAEGTFHCSVTCRPGGGGTTAAAGHSQVAAHVRLRRPTGQHRKQGSFLFRSRNFGVGLFDGIAIATLGTDQALLPDVEVLFSSALGALELQPLVAGDFGPVAAGVAGGQSRQTLPRDFVAGTDSQHPAQALGTLVEVVHRRGEPQPGVYVVWLLPQHTRQQPLAGLQIAGLYQTDGLVQ